MTLLSILLAAGAAGSEAQEIKSLSIEDLTNKLVHTIVDFTIHLGIAILVFYVGKFLIRRIYNFVASILVRRNVDKSLSTFIISLIKMVLYFILVIIIIGILGIDTASFIALFASAGVAIGMALSGTLQNFAGGVLILLLKPYKVGDYIETQGYSGTVTEIQIFSTIICTFDNKSILIPNGVLSTSSINNWSREDYRRVDWAIGISYGDSVERAREVILGMFENDDRIVKTTLADDREYRAEEEREESSETEPEDKPKRSLMWRMFHRGGKRLKDRLEAEPRSIAPLSGANPNSDRSPKVFLHSLGDSSVNLTIRAWVRSTDYWSVYFGYNERIYNELPLHGLSFPFPQMDVHLQETEIVQPSESAGNPAVK